MTYLIGQSNGGNSLWQPPSLGQKPNPAAKLELISADGNPLRSENLQTIIVADGNEIEKYGKTSSRDPIDHLYSLFTEVIDSLDEQNGKESAKTFFKHLSSNDDNAILLHNDREFDEVTHVIAKTGSKPQINKASLYLRRFDTANSKKQVDTLLKFLFDSLNQEKISTQERRTALRILFHGIAYFGNYNWQDQIPNFTHLLESSNSSIRIFAEQSLKSLTNDIDDDNAKSILKNLASKSRLSGDLAQALFDKFPILREEYINHDSRLNFSELSASDISTNLDYYANLASNQINPHIDSGGNLGIEIEMKLRGNSQGRDGDAIIYQELLSQEDISRLFIMGVDGYGQAAEIRSKRGGFRLNLDNRKTIRELATGLQKNPDLCFFLSNHINVDATERGHSGRLLNYRRDNGHYWESIACPITVTPLSLSTNLTSFRGRIVASSIDDGYLPYSLEASILCDLMTVHDVMRNAKHLHLSDLEKLSDVLNKSSLDAWRKEDFYHPQNQETIARVLIYQAKEMDRDDVIPAILRLQKAKTLPNLGAFSKAITSFALGNSNFSEVAQRFSGYNGETVSSFVNRALANGQAIAMSPIIRSILKSNGEWSGYIIDRLEAQDIHDPTIREILTTNTYSLSSRINLAAKVREFDYNDESKDLFENPNIPLEIQLKLAGKISAATRADFASVSKLLQRKDWDLLVQSVNNSINDRLIRRDVIELLQRSINHDHNSLEISFSLNEDVSDLLLLSSTPTNIKNLIARRLVSSGIDARIINLLEKTNRETAQILEGKVAEYYENQTSDIELTIEVERFIELASALGNKATSAICAKLIPAQHGFNSIFTARTFIANSKIPIALRIDFIRKCNFTLEEDLKVLLVNDRIPEEIRVEIVRKLPITSIDANAIDLLERFTTSNHVVQAIKRKLEDYLATKADNSIPFDETITKLYAIQTRLFQYVPFEGLTEKLEPGRLENENIFAFLNNTNINSREKVQYAAKVSSELNAATATMLTNYNLSESVRLALLDNLSVTGLDENALSVFEKIYYSHTNITNILDEKLAAHYEALPDDSVELNPTITKLFTKKGNDDSSKTRAVLLRKLAQADLSNPFALAFLNNDDINYQERVQYAAKVSSELNAATATMLTNYSLSESVRLALLDNLSVTGLDENALSVFEQIYYSHTSITNALDEKLAAHYEALPDDSIELNPTITRLFTKKGNGDSSKTRAVLLRKLKPMPLTNSLVQEFLNNSNIDYQERKIYAVKVSSELNAENATMLTNYNLSPSVRLALLDNLTVTGLDENVLSVFERIHYSHTNITNALDEKLAAHYETLPDDSVELNPTITKLFTKKGNGDSSKTRAVLLRKLAQTDLSNPFALAFLNNGDINYQERVQYAAKVSSELNAATATMLTNYNLSESVRLALLDNLTVTGLDQNVLSVFEQIHYSHTNITNALDEKLAAHYKTLPDDSVELNPTITKLFTKKGNGDSSKTRAVLLRKLAQTDLSNPFALAFLNNGDINYQERVQYAAKVSSELNAATATMLTNYSLSESVRLALLDNLSVTGLDENALSVFEQIYYSHTSITNALDEKLAAYYETLDDDSVELNPTITKLFTKKGNGDSSKTRAVLLRKLKPMPLTNSLVQEFLNNSSISKAERALLQNKCTVA